MKKLRLSLPYQLFMLALSVFSVAGVVLLHLGSKVGVNEDFQSLLHTFDFFVCGVFFLDFCYQFYKAPKKLSYMKWGWIDLLASIPSVDFLRFGRGFRIMRVVVILRTLKSSKQVYKTLIRNKRKSSIYIMAFASFFMIFLSSFGIILFEVGAEGSTIKSAGDAIWWSLATMTTVGYGDTYPVTLGGRILATVMMFMGIGLFSSFSGIVASLLMDKDGDGQVDIESDDIKKEIRELKKMILELKEDHKNNKDNDRAA